MADLGQLRMPYRGVTMDSLGSGIAPYGIRNSGQSVKGQGFFGMIPHAGGSGSSELSSEFDGIEHPLLVPTLSAEQIRHLLSGSEPTPEIYDKAESHALMRIKRGLSPFAGPEDLRYPVPK